MSLTQIIWSVIGQVSPAAAVSPTPADALLELSPTPLATVTPLLTPTPEVVDPSYAVRLIEFVIKGGPVMIPMILLAFFVFVLIVERYLYLVQINRGSRTFTLDFFKLWDAGKRAEATKLADDHPGPIARMLAAGIRAAHKDKETIRESMQEQALGDAPALNRFMAVIATIGTLMPIMGLLGTVTGMIKTFEVITIKGTGDPKALAGGISEALITTETGLIFAIPIILFHTFLSGRIERYLNDMEKFATRLLAGIKNNDGE